MKIFTKKDIHGATGLSLRKIQYITETCTLPRNFQGPELGKFKVEFHVDDVLQNPMNDINGIGHYRLYYRADLIIFFIIKQCLNLGISKAILAKILQMITFCCFMMDDFANYINKDKFNDGKEAYLILFPENFTDKPNKEIDQDSPSQLAMPIIMDPNHENGIITINQILHSESSAFIINVGQYFRKVLNNYPDS